MRVEVTNQLMRKLSAVQRAKIVEHVPGPLPIVRTQANKIKDYLIVEALRRLGLVKVKPHKSSFPTHSELTMSGREAAAKILAECADMLVAAGALEFRPLEVVQYLKHNGQLCLPAEAVETEQFEEQPDPLR